MPKSYKEFRSIDVRYANVSINQSAQNYRGVVFTINMIFIVLGPVFPREALFNFFLNGPTSSSFSFIFIFSNKHYNSYNK